MIECDECVYWIFCERDGILLCKDLNSQIQESVQNEDNSK